MKRLPFHFVVFAVSLSLGGCPPPPGWGPAETSDKPPQKPARTAPPPTSDDPAASAPADPLAERVDEYVRSFDQPAEPSSETVAADPPTEQADSPPARPRRTRRNQPSGLLTGTPESTGTEPPQSPRSADDVVDPAAIAQRASDGESRSSFDGDPPATEGGETPARLVADDGAAPSPPPPTSGAMQPRALSDSRSRGPAAPAVISMSVAAAPPPRDADRRGGPVRANQPADATVASADRLADLERRVAADPNDMDAQLRLRLLYLADGQDDKAQAPTPGMLKERQEVLLALVRMLMTSRSQAGRDTAQWANRQLAEIRGLEAVMRQRADLQVPKVVLCRRTESFGVYDEISPAEFPAGRVNPVLAYVEVANFRHESVEGGFRSRLAARIAIIDRSGQEVWSRSEDRIEDFSRNQRQDFFVSLDVPIPAALNPGAYTLKASITDLVGEKTNESQTAFTLIAQ